MITVDIDNMPEDIIADIHSHLCSHCAIMKRDEYTGAKTCPFGMDPNHPRCPYGEDFDLDLQSIFDNWSEDLTRFANNWFV